MKFNLKNRPKKIESANVFTKSDTPFQWYSVERIDKWFEGFEKELRERIMDISCGTKPNRTECWTIKEILGEV